MFLFRRQKKFILNQIQLILCGGLHHASRADIKVTMQICSFHYPLVTRK
jgi:hypothetical protein